MTMSLAKTSRSRVGRRIVLQFMLAASVPLLVLGWLSYQALTTQSRAYAQHALDDDVSADAMRVFDRLLAARAALVVRHPADVQGPPGARRPGSMFRAVSFVDRTATPAEPPPGESVEAAGLRRWWSSETRAALRSLHWSAGTGAEPARFVLSVPDASGQGLWLGELDSGWLWNEAFAASEGGACVVIDADDQVLHGQSTVDRSIGDREAGDSILLRAEKRLFLGHEFGTADWRFRVQRPEAAVEVSGGLALGSLVIKVVLAALILVAILSLVQIRRTMRPLEDMLAMTRRLAMHDYGARIPLRGDDEFRELGESFNDMAQRLGQQTQALTHQAGHDGLTGLLNRHGLEQGLDAAIAAGRPFVLAFLDLDHFKSVNDSLGHQAGDEVLCLAAQRLRRSLPPEAMIARPGGDEFVVLLRDDGDEGSRLGDVVVDHTLGDLCKKLADAFPIQGRELVLGASIGWARFPEDGTSMQALMRHADMAMYAAKEQGRSRACRFAPAMDAAAAQRAWVVNDLRLAIERSQFVLHYQPRVSAATGMADTAEALVRWQHPQRGLLSPGLFVGIAEETGLIVDLGRWVLREACRQLAQWRRDGVSIESISVNLSARQLADPSVVDEVRSALKDHGLAPSNLELEVTESFFIGDASTAAERLTQLRELGIMIALDDFGTGYSSMAYLSRMPVDVIKIDRAFVKQLGEDRSADTVTRAIVTLAHSLDLRLVAEGVETMAQAEALKAMGCEQLQGYLYAKPVAPTDFVRLDCLRAPQAEPVN